MKTNRLGLVAICMIGLLTFGCTSSQKAEENNKETNDEKQEAKEIILTKAPPSPQFPDAQLTKSDVTVTPTDSGYVVSYSFDVQNYELGVQTEDAATRGIANSGKGQHIHYIVNDGPYTAHYMTDINEVLDEGNYVILAFLSRSYHESVKSEGAYYIENLTVGDVASSEVDLAAPHLFYSRPKGTYKGVDTEKLMLDFYLLNTTLAPEGNKVRATINGNEFIIDEWAPYYIEGLPMGEVTIKLELIDHQGNPIPGPYNVVERKVMLTEK